MRCSARPLPWFLRLAGRKSRREGEAKMLWSLIRSVPLDPGFGQVIDLGEVERIRILRTEAAMWPSEPACDNPRSHFDITDANINDMGEIGEQFPIKFGFTHVFGWAFIANTRWWT